MNILSKYKNIIEAWNWYFEVSKSIHHDEMKNGQFEPEVTRTIESLLMDSHVFIDVGANVGYYCELAQRAGNHVIAIEPQQGNLKKLYEIMYQENEVFPVGLSDRPGIEQLYGISSTGASLIPGWSGETKALSRKIPISTLDILLGNRFNSKRLLIKIDVEGMEYKVLKGAISTLNMSPKPTWIIEICDGEFHPAGKRKL